MLGDLLCDKTFDFNQFCNQLLINITFLFLLCGRVRKHWTAIMSHTLNTLYIFSSSMIASKKGRGKHGKEDGKHKKLSKHGKRRSHQGNMFLM